MTCRCYGLVGGQEIAQGKKGEVVWETVAYSISPQWSAGGFIPHSQYYAEEQRLAVCRCMSCRSNT